MIQVTNVGKHYRLYKREPGLLQAFKSLFHREYEIKDAVKDISFSIPKGEIVGYIGSNGAGKSTTIKMMSGILTPDEGEIKVNGIVPYEERTKNGAQIGAVFGQRTQLFWDIPVQESYQLLKHIYEVPEHIFKENIATFIEVLDLQPLLSIPVRNLSLGQKMRCELAAAFLHNPPVVYLDEPTIGLDASVKVKIRAFIKEMNKKRDTTIILTTHDMDDIEELCNRIILIDKGKIIFDGSLIEFKSHTRFNRIIEFTTLESNVVLPSTIKSIVKLEMHEDAYRLSYNTKELSSGDILKELMALYDIEDFTVTEPSVESIVEEIYNRGGME
ncbi:MAG: ATP-binding cassette domain-containing protein [Bacillaceae bacterium]